MKDKLTRALRLVIHVEKDDFLVYHYYFTVFTAKFQKKHTQLIFTTNLFGSFAPNRV